MSEMRISNIMLAAVVIFALMAALLMAAIDCLHSFPKIPKT